MLTKSFSFPHCGIALSFSLPLFAAVCLFTVSTMSGAYNLQCHSAFSASHSQSFTLSFDFYLLRTDCFSHAPWLWAELRIPWATLSDWPYWVASPRTPHDSLELPMQLFMCVCVCVLGDTVANPMDYYTIHNSPCPWPPLSKAKRSNFRFLNFLTWPRKHAFLNKQQSLTRRKSLTLVLSHYSCLECGCKG